MAIMYSPASEHCPFPVRILSDENPYKWFRTCFKPQGEYPKLSFLVGCGGYGEVSKNHPQAGSQLTEDPNGPYCCKMCGGSGVIIHERIAEHLRGVKQVRHIS